jgi:cytochrome b561
MSLAPVPSRDSRKTIALHAAAALLHHYVRRDDTVRRMLPGKD